MKGFNVKQLVRTLLASLAPLFRSDEIMSCFETNGVVSNSISYSSIFIYFYFKELHNIKSLQIEDLIGKSFASHGLDYSFPATQYCSFFSLKIKRYCCYFLGPIPHICARNNLISKKTPRRPIYTTHSQAESAKICKAKAQFGRFSSYLLT